MYINKLRYRQLLYFYFTKKFMMENVGKTCCVLVKCTSNVRGTIMAAIVW